MAPVGQCHDLHSQDPGFYPKKGTEIAQMTPQVGSSGYRSVSASPEGLHLQKGLPLGTAALGDFLPHAKFCKAMRWKPCRHTACVCTSVSFFFSSFLPNKQECSCFFPFSSISSSSLYRLPFMAQLSLLYWRRLMAIPGWFIIFLVFPSKTNLRKFDISLTVNLFGVVPSTIAGTTTVEWMALVLKATIHKLTKSLHCFR